MRTIEVDFDVFKALTMRRPTEDVTENDVLRDLLALPPRPNRSPANAIPAAGGWVVKNVRFPAGTEFRAVYKGRTYLGRVEGEALTLNGKRFDSPSAAAVDITGSPTNGWRFWQCRLPGQSQWRPLDTLRNRTADVA
jgi:Protein of unknown function (DUF2924)